MESKKESYIIILKYLNSEHKRLKNTIEEITPIFNNELAKLSNKINKWSDEKKLEQTPENSNKVPLINDEELEIGNKTEKKNIEPEITKFYRKISKIIHPDKSDDEIDVSLFKLCTKSREENILYKMLLISENIGAEYELNDKHYKLLDKEITQLKDKIKELENSLVLVWDGETNGGEREKILIRYMKGERQP